MVYQVSVLFDVSGDARPPEWVVQESEAVDLSFDGQRIEREKVLLALPGDVVEHSQMTSSFNPEQFLRERGLFASEGDFIFFEAILPAGAEAKGQRFSSGVLLVSME